jgi:dihydrofolate reductase
MNGVGVIAMGSTTYEWLYEHLVASASQPWPYQVPSFVFTSRKDRPLIKGADIRFVSGNVKPVHAEMAALSKRKNIWVVGGGDLAAQFYDSDLLDELQLQIAPITLGKGAPVFPRHLKAPFKLLSARQLDQNFVELIYGAKK